MFSEILRVDHFINERRNMKRILLVLALLLVFVSCKGAPVVIEEPEVVVEEVIVIEEPAVVEEVEEVEEPVVLEPAIGAWAGKDMFYFDGCAPNHKNTFFAQVNDLDVIAVSLHVRFTDMEGEGWTEWYAFDMAQQENKDWSVTLIGNDLKPLIKNFEFMWMEYQAVAWSVPGAEAALRSEVQSVNFEVCQ